ncbi:MAG: tetratricopeptide repeat protein [Candidatus Kryptonium sp.]
MQYKNLILISLLFLIGCAKKEDLTLLQRAEQEYQNKNLKTAIEIYNYFVETYPKSEKAPEILFKLAKIYYGELQLPKEAVKFLEQIIQNYPDSKEAMNSLFLLGFIYANEIKDYTKAKEYYQKFLEKYPNSELATSAKFELENLGKGLDNISTK